MIHLERRTEGLVAVGDLEGTAFVDGAWLVPGPLRAVVARDGEVTGPSGEAVAGLDATDPAAAAAAVYYGIAEGAVRALEAAWPGPVETLGDGALGYIVRSLVNERVPRASGSTRPLAVIDTTGDPETIRDAIDRLDDLGLLVLSAPPAARLDLNLYPDIHVRGLRVVGVPAEAAVAEQAQKSGLGRVFSTLAVESLTIGAPIAGGVMWCELRPA